MHDRQYIEGLRQHDNQILEAIYKNFSKRIGVFIRENGGSLQDHEDVFQDALMIILKKVKSSDFELKSSFYTYLFSVCKFVWYAKKRKKANQSVTISNDETLIDTTDIEKAILERELYHVYQENFRKLSITCQSILTFFFAKKSMTEIAQTLQLKNEQAARARKFRCREKLRKLVEMDERYQELIQETFHKATTTASMSNVTKKNRQ